MTGISYIALQTVSRKLIALINPKVKLTLRFRGREMVHQDLGAKVLDRVRIDLGESIKVEQYPKMEGRQMTMVIAPK